MQLRGQSRCAKGQRPAQHLDRPGAKLSLDDHWYGAVDWDHAHPPNPVLAHLPGSFSVLSHMQMRAQDKSRYKNIEWYKDVRARET